MLSDYEKTICFGFHGTQTKQKKNKDQSPNL